MPLLATPAPAPALRTILAALASPTAVREATPALRSHQGRVTPQHPLPLHILDTSGDGSHPPATRLGGWRFQIHGEDGMIAAAEAMLTPDGWAFSHFFEGPYVSSTERALRQAESLPAPLQPRLLSVPGLYMLTLWLHADTTDDGASGRLDPADLLIPLAPAPCGFAAHRPHRVADFMPLVSNRLVPAAAGLLRTSV